jgi:hypothetical protein
MLLLSVLLPRVLLLLLWDCSVMRDLALLCWSLWLRDIKQCCKLQPADSMLLNVAAKV